jgi:hypothetical protein
MAQCTKSTCERCGFPVDWWNDGNRYLEWPAGMRHYLYHPRDISETERIMNLIYGQSPSQADYNRAFQLYGGNESAFLCLSCAEVSRIDPKRHPMKCKKCGASSLRAVRGLAKTSAQNCRQGRFDEGSIAGIS